VKQQIGASKSTHAQHFQFDHVTTAPVKSKPNSPPHPTHVCKRQGPQRSGGCELREVLQRVAVELQGLQPPRTAQVKHELGDAVVGEVQLTQAGAVVELGWH